jgi:hypothetical protein
MASTLEAIVEKLLRLRYDTVLGAERLLLYKK